MEEIWKEFKEDYEVSSLGRVKSYKRGRRGRILIPRPNSGGYMRIILDYKKELVHRLVAKLFLPNPGNLPVVNHKDGDRTNNCVDNLEWITQGENIKKAYETGKAKPSENQRQAIIKTNHLKRKMVKQYDLENNLIREFRSVREASEILKISPAMISLICRGKRKSKEFILRY
jgi:hypothetical protein